MSGDRRSSGRRRSGGRQNGPRQAESILHISLFAPADLPKTGTAADLAIAIGILVGSEQFTPRAGRAALIGELSLGGEVRSVPGLLPMVLALARRGVGRVVVPADGAAEARLVDGVEILPAGSIPEGVDALRARRRSSPRQPDRVELATAGVGDAPSPTSVAIASTDSPDLADVRGHAEARRALEVALAGGHGLLLMGPPGTGKTLLARTIPGLQPPLEDDEALTATIVASVSGEGPMVGLVRRAPYRAPHHTSSYAAMVGGGPALAPGEVTRADHGV